MLPYDGLYLQAFKRYDYTDSHHPSDGTDIRLVLADSTSGTYTHLDVGVVVVAAAVV